MENAGSSSSSSRVYMPSSPFPIYIVSCSKRPHTLPVHTASLATSMLGLLQLSWLEKMLKSLDNLLGTSHMPASQSLLGRRTDRRRENPIGLHLELNIRQLSCVFRLKRRGDSHWRLENDWLVGVLSTGWEDGSERSEHVFIGLRCQLLDP